MSFEQEEALETDFPQDSHSNSKFSYLRFIMSRCTLIKIAVIAGLLFVALTSCNGPSKKLQAENQQLQTKVDSLTKVIQHKDSLAEIALERANQEMEKAKEKAASEASSK